VAGRKYFAFSKYENQGSTVVSKCDQLMNGWTHDIFDRNWACYTGYKPKATTPKVHHMALTK